jgi:hypothetical protein
MVWHSHDLVPKHPRANRVKKTQRKCVGNLVLGHCRTTPKKITMPKVQENMNLMLESCGGCLVPIETHQMGKQP